MDNRDQQRQKFLRQDGKPGQELPDIAQAQSEIYGIQGEMQNNLRTQRMLHQSRMQNRQVLQQAAGMASMGQQQGPPQVIPQQRRTDNSILRQYGIGKPGQSSKTTNQTQVIQSGPSKIENRYITTTKNDIKIVQPQIPMSQPVIPMGQGGGGGNNMARFQSWLSSLFAKQQVEDAKQEKEYNRREWSLQRTANKMLSKMTNLTRGFAEKINPQNMATSLGSQLKLFGVLFLTYLTGKYWTPLMKRLDSFEAGIRVAFGLDMSDYTGTAVGDKSRSIVGKIKSFLGIDPNDSRKTLIGGIRDIFESGTQKLLDGLKLILKDRAEAIKSVKLPDFSGASKIKFGPFDVDLSGINGMLQSGIGYLGDILTVLAGGSAGAVRASARKITTQGAADLGKLSQGEGFSKTRNTDVFGNLKTDSNSTYLASKSIGMALNDRSSTAYTGAVATGLSQLSKAADRAGSVVISREMLIDAGFGPYLDRLYRSGDLKEEKVKIIQVAKNKEDLENSTGNIDVSKATAWATGAGLVSATAGAFGNLPLAVTGQLVGHGAGLTAAAGVASNDWYRDEIVPLNSNRVGADGKPGRIATVYRITKNGFKTLQRLGHINSFDVEDKDYINFVQNLVERKKKQNGVIGKLTSDQTQNFQHLRDTQARYSNYQQEVEAWRTSDKYAPFNTVMQNTGNLISRASNWIGYGARYAGAVIRGGENSSMLAFITGGRQFKIGGRFGDDRSWNRNAAQRAAGNTKHQGIDISCPIGTPVCAPESGTITDAKTSNGGTGGRFVQMVSDDGKRKYFMCHLQEVYVKQGDSVQQGQVLGLSGASGHGKDRGYSAHLHFQVGYTDQKGPYGNGWVDPLSFFAGNEVQLMPAPQLSDSQIPSIPTNNSSGYSLSDVQGYGTTGLFGNNFSNAPILEAAAQFNGATGHAEAHGTFNPGNTKGSAFAIGKDTFSTFSNWVDGYAGCGYTLLRYAGGDTKYMPRNPTLRQMHDAWTGGKDEAHLESVSKYAGIYPDDRVPVTFDAILVILLSFCKFDSGHCNVDEAKEGLKKAWDRWISEGGRADTSGMLQAGSELWTKTRDVAGDVVQGIGGAIQTSSGVTGNFFSWLGGDKNITDPLAFRQATKESRETKYQEIMRQNSESFMEKAYGAKKDNYGMYIERGNSKIYLRAGTDSIFLTADDVEAVNVRANSDSGWKDPKDDEARNRAINEVISGIDDLYTYNEKGTSTDVLLNSSGKPALFDLGYFNDIQPAENFPGFKRDAIRIYGSKGIHYQVSFSKDGRRLRRILTDEINLDGILSASTVNHVSHPRYLDSGVTYQNNRKRYRRTTPYLYQKSGFKDGTGKVHDWNPIYMAIGVAPMLTPAAQKSLNKLQEMLQNATFEKLSNTGYNLKNKITGERYSPSDREFAEKVGLVDKPAGSEALAKLAGKQVSSSVIENIDNLKRTISEKEVTKQLGLSEKLSKEALENEFKAHPDNYKQVGSELFDIKSGIKVGNVSSDGNLTVLSPQDLKDWLAKHHTELEDNKQKFQTEIKADLYQQNGIFNPDLVQSSFAGIAGGSPITNERYQDYAKSETINRIYYGVPIGGILCDVKLDETGTKVQAIRYHTDGKSRAFYKADGSKINMDTEIDMAKIQEWTPVSNGKFPGFDTSLSGNNISQALSAHINSLAKGNGFLGDNSRAQSANVSLKGHQFTYKTGIGIAEDAAFQKTLKELQEQHKENPGEFISGDDGIIWDKDYTMPIGKQEDGKFEYFSNKKAGLTLANYEVGEKSRRDLFWVQQYGAVENEKGEWVIYSKDGKTRVVLSENAPKNPNAPLQDIAKRIDVFEDGKWQNARSVKTWSGKINPLNPGTYDTEIQDQYKSKLGRITKELNESGTVAERVYTGISNLAGGDVTSYLQQVAKYNDQFLTNEERAEAEAQWQTYLLEAQQKEAEGIEKMANAYDAKSQSLIVTNSEDLEDRQTERVEKNKQRALSEASQKIKEWSKSNPKATALLMYKLSEHLKNQYDLTPEDLQSAGFTINKDLLYDAGTEAVKVPKTSPIGNSRDAVTAVTPKETIAKITAVGGKPFTYTPADTAAITPKLTVNKREVSKDNPVPTQKSDKDKEAAEKQTKAIVRATVEVGNAQSENIAAVVTELRESKEYLRTLALPQSSSREYSSMIPLSENRRDTNPFSKVVSEPLTK